MDASERRGRARDEAAEWWVRLQESETSLADRALFVDWLCESALHVSEFLRIAYVHNALQCVEDWTRIDVEDRRNDETVIEFPGNSPFPVHQVASSDNVNLECGNKTPGLTRRRAWFAAIAAGVCALAVFAGSSLIQLHDNTIETMRGERREVSLKDGSVLQVDPQSRLRIEFEERERRVFLERGRAMFRVAKAPHRPFVVYANKTMVRAVGTAFGVDQHRDGVVVTVAEGTVAVRPAMRQERRTRNSGNSAVVSSSGTNGEDKRVATEPRPVTAPAIRKSDAREILLDANQQMIVQRSGVADSVRRVDSSVELAWVEGRLVFDNDTVATVVEEFNRYNHAQIRVFDETLLSRPVSGVFSATDPESFIAFIQTVEQVRTTRDGDRNITIVPTRPGPRQRPEY